MTTAASRITRSELKKYFNYRILTPHEIEVYEKCGYLHLREMLTPEGVERMSEESMEAWAGHKRGMPTNGTWLQSALLVNIHHHSPLVRAFYFHGPLMHIASQLIGPNIKGATSQLTFKMRGNSRQFGWHQDNGYGQLSPYNSVTTLTSFDRTDQENGCIWLIPGSHRGGQIDLGDQMTAEAKAAGTDFSVEIDDSKDTGAIPMDTEPGDVLLFHCLVLHKSEGNHSLERDRRVLFLRYADADAVEVYNNHKPRLGKLLKGETKFQEVLTFEADLD